MIMIMIMMIKRMLIIIYTVKVTINQRSPLIMKNEIQLSIYRPVMLDNNIKKTLIELIILDNNIKKLK